MLAVEELTKPLAGTDGGSECCTDERNPATTLPDQKHQRKSEAEEGHFAGPFHRDFIDTLIRQKLLPADVHLFLLSDDETAAEKAKGEKLTAELSVAQKTIAEAEAKGVRLAGNLKGQSLLI